MSDPEVTPLEVYAMVVARDALIEQLLTASGNTEVANLWRMAIGEADNQIRHGLLDNIQDLDGK